MGTIKKRGDKYRGMVRKTGFRARYKTFATSKAAKEWVADVERDLRNSIPTDPNIQIVKLISIYVSEIAPKRRGLAPSHLKHDVPAIQKKFVNMKMRDLQGDGLVDWVFRENLSGPTTGWHINRLFGVLKQCELALKVRVPWQDMRRCYENLKEGGYITPARIRERRISDVELDRMKAKLSPTTATWACDLFDFAVTTAMRISEICRITWEDFDEERRTVIIRDRKHPRKKIGNHKVVPLLSEAFEIVLRQRGMRYRKDKKIKDRIFPRLPTHVSRLFHDAATDAGIKDVVLHDLRHEGISRLFELGFQIQEVALISGHEDWKMLRRYTHLRPATLIERERQLRAVQVAA
jgi:integrase